MANLVVARFLDGTTIKGTSLDVQPTRPTCHVTTPDGSTQLVALKELKALFFVRSLEGDAAHDEQLTPDPADPRLRGAQLVSMRFADHEQIVGLTVRYPPLGDYFFVLPVDPRSNNVRILVNRAALVAIKPFAPAQNAR